LFCLINYSIQYDFILVAYFLFWFSVVITSITFPLAFYVYDGILNTEIFKTSYIYKLIIVNGIANCLRYYTHVGAIQIGVLPDLHEYFSFLNHNYLVCIFVFGFLFADAFQKSTSTFISINRLLSVWKGPVLRNVN
ncbi:hypothetical protein PFISCL1PPCAC_18757, partial [Pristionchus fissidentatus]